MRREKISDRKRIAAAENSKLGVAAVAARIAKRPLWTCRKCGSSAIATVHQMRKTYCSKACEGEDFKSRMIGSANPNYRDAGKRVCEWCSNEYRSYNKVRKYCSHFCYRLADAEKVRIEPNMRYAPRKDDNHADIVRTLEKCGACVIDLAEIGRGCPDLVVWIRDEWHMVEIKNPKTYYGKKGLNKNQKEWAIRAHGARIHVIRTIDEAIEFARGGNTLPAKVVSVSSVEEALEAIQ